MTKDKQAVMRVYGEVFDHVYETIVILVYWLYWLFFVEPTAAECWRGRGGKFSRIHGKNTISIEHPVSTLILFHFICLPFNEDLAQNLQKRQEKTKT